MAPPYRRTLSERFWNAVLRRLVPRSVGPPYLHLLTVVGWRTGRRYSTPIAVVETNGARWIVAADGRRRSWVRNARAAGWVELSRGRRTERARILEAPPGEAVSILREYVRTVPMTRKFFDARADSPPEAFAAEQARHPVFRLETAEPPADQTGTTPLDE